MRVARWPGRQGPFSGRSVVTLGVFDGVHRGHAEVIGRVVSAARRRGCQAAVVTFDRHPSVLFDHRPAPAITSLEHRIRLFEALGVDVCVVMEFSEAVAQMPAEEFARTVFHDLLGAELLVLGFDCRFGRGRQGDVELCRRLGPELGFEVESVPPVEFGGRPVSSTAIRQAVTEGDLDGAESLLGRPFSLFGTVVRGEGRGRRIGFPTANLDPHNEILPPEGIYATWLFAGACTAAQRDQHRPQAHLPRGRIWQTRWWRCTSSPASRSTSTAATWRCSSSSACGTRWPSTGRTPCASRSAGTWRRRGACWGPARE